MSRKIVLNPTSEELTSQAEHLKEQTGSLLFIYEAQPSPPTGRMTKKALQGPRPADAVISLGDQDFGKY